MEEWNSSLNSFPSWGEGGIIKIKEVSVSELISSGISLLSLLDVGVGGTIESEDVDWGEGGITILLDSSLTSLLS